MAGGLLILAVGAAMWVIALHPPHTASAPAAHSVTLRWRPVSDAVSYVVYRSKISGGPYEKIGKTTVPTYVDRPVPPGSVFYYVVTTVAQSGESKFSAEVRAVVPAD